jgi:hypothetical protein
MPANSSEKREKRPNEERTDEIKIKTEEKIESKFWYPLLLSFIIIDTSISYFFREPEYFKKHTSEQIESRDLLDYVDMRGLSNISTTSLDSILNFGDVCNRL